MIPGSANPLLLATAAPTGYNIERSLRFNSADSAYLSRTPASAGNRKTFTISLWVKRCKLGVLQSFTSSANNTILLFDVNDKLNFYLSAYVRTSTQVFRDTSAWYHIVLAVDTTNATAQNRVRIYVNNNEITTWATNTTVTQNLDTTWNDALAHQIGANNTSQFADQYIADFHNIDGQALTPTSFGEFDVNNVWQPKAYTGSYGTNGFQLKFADNSAATAAALGKDTSGNGNNWTPNNLSVTAGAGNDSLVDTPTSYGTDASAGGEVRGNYCTLNPLDKNSNCTLSNGNLEFSTGTADYGLTRATFGMSSGKWYWEITPTSGAGSANFFGCGIAKASASLATYLGDTNSWSYFSGGSKYGNGSGATAYGAQYENNDVIGVAFDADNGTLTFYRNGTSQGQAFSGLTSGPYFPAVSDGGTSGSASGVTNFGQRPFAYPVSGFKALCDTNLPAPVVAKSASAFDVKLYTGNGSTQTISGLGFSPDFVWIKERSSTSSHQLYDTIRGATKTLYSNNTNEEQTNANALTSFTSTGFDVGVDNNVNESAQTYAAWCWDAGSSTVTNTQGSITGTVSVRANTSAGFSIVTYTGTGANATVGHGLGVAPKWVIVKRRENTADWCVWVKEVYDLSNSSFLFLNTTDASYSNANVFNSSTTTATTFPVGSNNATNAASSTYVAYCFAPVAGYSAFGSYTGNGSADGPFVFCGFRPAVVIVKMSSSTGNWTILDDKREGYNVDNDPLYPNLTDAEGTTDLIDITSNGFKVRTTDATFNTNAGTYVYAAWASSPFAYARAR